MLGFASSPQPTILQPSMALAKTPSAQSQILLLCGLAPWREFQWSILMRMSSDPAPLLGFASSPQPTILQPSMALAKTPSAQSQILLLCGLAPWREFQWSILMRMSSDPAPLLGFASSPQPTILPHSMALAKTPSAQSHSLLLCGLAPWREFRRSILMRMSSDSAPPSPPPP